MAHQRPILPPIPCFHGRGYLCALLAAGSVGLTNAQDPAHTPELASGSEPAIVHTPAGPVPVTSDEAVPVEQAGLIHVGLITRLEAQLIIRDLVDHNKFVEAVPVAKRVAKLTGAEFGTTSSEAADAISNLAEVQRRAGLYEDSEQNFLAAVDIFQQNEGKFAASLITPLVGLGEAYHAMGEYPQAVTVFQEARTVNRRVYGLLNEDQIEIMDHLANTMISMQWYEEAERQKLAALRIRERIHGSDSLEILPAIYKHALWLREGYRFQEARDYYWRAMSIIRELEGEDSPLLVHPLCEIGNSFRLQKLPAGRGINSHLKRALEILQAQPEPDKLQIAEVLRDLGDWYTAFSMIGPTGNEYRKAWALLDEVDNGAALQRRWFYEPTYVLRENPSTRGITNASTPGAQPGHVVVVFDVTPSGKTTNVLVIESVPPGLKDDAIARSIARSRFRPRILDGEIVLAEGLARNFTFYYTPEFEEE